MFKGLSCDSMTIARPTGGAILADPQPSDRIKPSPSVVVEQGACTVHPIQLPPITAGVTFWVRAASQHTNTM